MASSFANNWQVLRVEQVPPGIASTSRRWRTRLGWGERGLSRKLLLRNGAMVGHLSASQQTNQIPHQPGWRNKTCLQASRWCAWEITLRWQENKTPLFLILRLFLWNSPQPLSVDGKRYCEQNKTGQRIFQHSLHCFLLLAMRGKGGKSTTIQTRGVILALEIRRAVCFLILLFHYQVQRIHETKQLLATFITLYFALINPMDLVPFSSL